MLGDPTRIVGKDNASQWAGRRGGAMWTESRTPGVGDASYLGSYGFSIVTGVLTGTGNALTARWSHATKIAVVTKLKWRFLPLAPATSPSPLTRHTSFAAIQADSFTGNFSNGATVDLSGNNGKRRASMATSAFGQIMYRTGAALAGGIGTLYPHDFLQSLRTGSRVNPAAGTEEVIQPSTDDADATFSADRGDHPLVLSQDTGFIIRVAVTWAAGSTGILFVEMDWSEYETAADY